VLAWCITEAWTVDQETDADAAAVATEAHAAPDDAAAGSDPVAGTDLSQQDQRQLAAPEAFVRSDVEPCAAVSIGTSNVPHETDDQLGADRADTLAEEEPVDAVGGGDDSVAAVHTGREAEPLPFHEAAAAASAPIWPEEPLDRFHQDDGGDDGRDSDAEATDMNDSRPPSRVVSPQQSFSWRQLPDPDFWGSARSGPLDVSQHALGALPVLHCWAAHRRYQPWAKPTSHVACDRN